MGLHNRARYIKQIMDHPTLTHEQKSLIRDNVAHPALNAAEQAIGVAIGVAITFACRLNFQVEPAGEAVATSGGVTIRRYEK